ncbi:MAG: methionyl-tRNA formyltransferase, partial [Spirochaetales bacterium]|nr:methionyl-tRNA formyltransferase [Spirochaetales bacterium]
MTEPRILFAGTPEISVPLLRALNENFNVVGVLTSCDKSVGRSKALVPSPVKAAALEMNLPVLQFDSLRTEARQEVKKLGADTLISFAFGKIFGPRFLDMFPNGRFNVHPSALPVFRGPSPIQFTILNGLR